MAAAATDAHNVHSQEGKLETILVRGRRLTIIGRLGEGACSIVFLVQDPGCHNRRYALKRLVVQREEDLPRLIEEMERTERLSHHPFICACYGYEVARVEGKSYAVMLLQHGGTPLVNILASKASQRQQVGQGDVVRMALQIGSAISFMHHQDPPVAHRDIKAENIMEARGVYRLVDFGSASTLALEPRTATEFIRVLNEVSSQTTLAYRAPEMCDVYRKHRIDQQVDVWAFGVLMYYCMYLQLPFEETTLSILAGNVKFPATPAFDAPLVAAVKNCLVQNPAERWTIDDCVRFLGDAFRADEQLVREFIHTMEDDENPHLLNKPGDHVTLVAAGAVGRQHLSPICVAAAAAGVAVAGGGDASSADQPAWMAAGGSGGAASESATASQAAAGAAAPKPKGGLMQKLHWAGNTAGGGGAGGGIGGAPSSSAPTTQTQTQPPSKPASALDGIDSIFGAVSGGGGAQQQHQQTASGATSLFDPFAPAGTMTTPAPWSPVIATTPLPLQQQQQQQPVPAQRPSAATTVGGGASGATALDIFGTPSPTLTAPSSSVWAASAGAAPKKPKEVDPFESLYKK